jgi:hypothetical protein
VVRFFVDLLPSLQLWRGIAWLPSGEVFFVDLFPSLQLWRGFAWLLSGEVFFVYLLLSLQLWRDVAWLLNGEVFSCRSVAVPAVAMAQSCWPLDAVSRVLRKYPAL